MGSICSTNSQEDLEEDRRSLVLFLLGSCGYEEEADRVARTSKRILESEQIVEGISRFQFPNTGRTRLMHAAKTGNLERLNFIADLGARVNMTTHSRWDEGFTALHYASNNCHLDCMSSLLDKGADINAQTNCGFTALHFVSWSSNSNLVPYLCERGADMNLQTYKGWTALRMASNHDERDTVRYLCRKGANTLLVDDSGNTPYRHITSKYGYDFPMSCLLAKYPH